MERTLLDCIRPYSTIAIAGMCKNAGKTTVLVHLLEALRAEGETVALTSIGYDGEDTDLVTGTEKPGIHVPENTLVATAASLLSHCDTTKEILATTGVTTPLGEVVLFRARSAGKIVLAGPSQNADLDRVLSISRQFGAGKILVDGALNRRTFSAGEAVDTTILCTGASLATGLDAVVEETAFVLELLDIPLCEIPELEANNRWVLFSADGNLHSVGDGPLPQVLPSGGTLIWNGAVTDATASPLLRATFEGEPPVLVFEDASKLLFGWNTWRKLQSRGYLMGVRRVLHISALCVNPFSAYGAHLDGRQLAYALRTHTTLPIFDVLGGQSHDPA